MQMDAIMHFREIVLPAIIEFEQAQYTLGLSVTSSSPEATVTKQTYAAFRSGAAATLFLYHFADVVSQQPPLHVPNFQRSVKRVHRWLEEQNVELSGDYVRLLIEAAHQIEHPNSNETLPFHMKADRERLKRGMSGEARKVDGVDEGAETIWLMSRGQLYPLSSILASVSKIWQLTLNVT